MGEKEDKEKAEKLAAAKKRVAQLQKKKKAAGSTGGTTAAEKSTKDKSKPNKDDTPKSSTKETADGQEGGKVDEDAVDAKDVTSADKEEASATIAADDEKPIEAVETAQPKSTKDEPITDDDEAEFNNVIQAAADNNNESLPQEDRKSPESITPSSAEQGRDAAATSTTKPSRSGRQASISLQSKLRSTSFRDTPLGGPLSPGVSGLTKVEELEKENKRLAKEAEDHESRWRRLEEELEELREESVSKSGEEVEKLKAEIETLKRQQQRQNSGAGLVGARGSSRRESLVAADSSTIESSLRKELENKDSTVSDMQLEISRLRSQISSQTEGCETHGSQITALQTALTTTETKLRALETELTDTKKSLTRASEKAVLDVTERTSKETQIRNLERDMADAISQRDEVVKKADQLEKKVEAMNKLHREAETRNASRLSQAETGAREVPLLRAKLEKIESENARLRERHKRHVSGDQGDDEGLDELEDEGRAKLTRRIRELEGQVFDLQRGVWRDKRVALQHDPAADGKDGGGRASLEQVGEDFDDVDLSGSGHVSSRRRSLAAANLLGGGGGGGGSAKHSGFAQVLNSGLAAFRGAAVSPDSAAAAQQQQGGVVGRQRNDSLLQDLDDDDMFDEGAFARAQQEEEARKMVEHVREVKRGLKQWVGWRLDLVDARRGGGGGVGVGEIFEV